MKKYLLFTFVITACFQGFSQPDAIYSQYMYNQFVINPAYAGSRNSMSALLLHRTRWTGIQNAPSTSTFTLQSRLSPKNLAWGVNFAADRLGPVTNVLAGLAASYHVRLSKGKLAFGLRGGFYSRSINGAKLDFRDSSDPLFSAGRQSSAVPTLDFGIYYYTRKFYLSLGLNHLGSSTFNFSEFPDASMPLRQFNTLGLGYAFEVSDNVVLKPSLLLKQSDGFDTNLDINISALFYKRLWFGISFRNNTTVNFLLDVNVTDYIRMGYSYDIFVNSLNKASNGAHEFFIGFDFNKNETKTVSPRYL